MSADWHGLLELQRRLIEPWVVRASEQDLAVARVVTLSDPASGPPGPGWEQRLQVTERRRCSSVLTPVHLHLTSSPRSTTATGRSGSRRWARACGRASCWGCAGRTSTSTPVGCGSGGAWPASTATSNAYVHVLEQRQRQVAAAMDAVLGG